jgi:EF hand domain-containing protein
MRTFLCAIFGCGALLAAASSLVAQPPGQGRGNTPKTAGADDWVARMMAFDENKDGKLAKSEVTDERLHRLFDRADTDKDGTVTPGELNALQVRERANTRGRSSGFGGPGGGPGGFGGPGGGGRGGFGGPGGGPPQPGQILPAMLRQRLSLTADQQEQVDALQKEVDAKLDKILTSEQKQQLKQMRERGPGGFGPGGPPPGGPGGFGPPPGGDGPPPDGDGPPPGRGRRPRGEAPPPPPDETL